MCVLTYIKNFERTSEALNEVLSFCQWHYYIPH